MLTYNITTIRDMLNTINSYIDTEPRYESIFAAFEITLLGQVNNHQEICFIHDETWYNSDISEYSDVYYQLIYYKEYMPTVLSLFFSLYKKFLDEQQYRR